MLSISYDVLDLSEQFAGGKGRIDMRHGIASTQNLTATVVMLHDAVNE